MKEILNEITGLRIGILITYIVVLLYHNKNKKEAKLLFCCVTIGLINEMVILVLDSFKISLPFDTTTIYVIVNGYLWLLILKNIATQKRIITMAISVFLTFSFFNFLFLEGVKSFNTLTFILGSLVYVLIFIYDSFVELKKESLDYFTSNSYLLIAIPILYFIGFSFIFAFKNKELCYIVVCDKITLYDFISYFSNFFYCFLIIYYIYRENKLKND